MYLCIHCWHVCTCLEPMHACLRACVHEFLCMQERCQNIGVRMHGDILLLPVNGSGFIGIWEKKAVYIMSYTVTDGHNNAVRQGLVGRFLGITSIDGVCALHSKCAPHGGRDGVSINLPLLRWRLTPHDIIAVPRAAMAKSTEFENLIYNNCI